MKNEQEMMSLIKSFASDDERIRAVYMNGSRTNPNVPKDMFQDYDIVFVATEVQSFIKDQSWINFFGDLIMMQEPDKNDHGSNLNLDSIRSYGFLMLFTDGNRIDLHIQTEEVMLEEYGEDKLTLPILDKDELLPTIPRPTDVDYHVQEPTENEFNRLTNDFWWCLQNVAKGIWRDELPYAKRMFEYTTRAPLDQMVAWWIGIQQDFQVSVGKLGKYFKDYLPESYWEMYQETYSDANYSNMWDSIFVTCELFRTLSQDVAEHFNFTYPIEDDQNMTKYLKDVRDLSPEAQEIY
ncbi:aminoglycoside 6-adenylyltransferase [Aquisalibacillus elongatus]|uniref:Aminoglycoside 6-adenylyltransferase n=1 Tax=Aquisalibacillus elongatus TaxID=485577 RepID=A0A3N5BSA9_9BACI|nr:aminoglycoside 6-adenylyltransferase [Aquisalibacillus elongatus]RPF50382.1 aminoglycoside 6-adenylyltransferase [Aquisalibacillus elongatus]